MLPAAGGAPLFLIHHPSLQTPLHSKHSHKSPSAAAFISSAAISGSIDLVIRSSAPSRSSKGGKVTRALCSLGPGLWCCPEAGLGWDLLGSSLWGAPSQSVPVVEGPSPTGSSLSRRCPGPSSASVLWHPLSQLQNLVEICLNSVFSWDSSFLPLPRGSGCCSLCLWSTPGEYPGWAFPTLASFLLCYTESGLNELLQEYFPCLQILPELFSNILSAGGDGRKGQQTHLAL